MSEPRLPPMSPESAASRSGRADFDWLNALQTLVVAVFAATVGLLTRSWWLGGLTIAVGWALIWLGAPLSAG